MYSKGVPTHSPTQLASVDKSQLDMVLVAFCVTAIAMLLITLSLRDVVTKRCQSFINEHEQIKHTPLLCSQSKWSVSICSVSVSVIGEDLGFAPRSGASLCTLLKSHGSNCTSNNNTQASLATLRGPDSYSYENKACVSCCRRKRDLKSKTLTLIFVFLKAPSNRPTHD